MTRIFALSYPAKKKIAQIALTALGVSFEYLSKRCPALMKEIAPWEEGRVFALSVMRQGPSISLKKENGGIRFLGSGLKDPHVTFYFKNVDSALMVFVGMMGAHTASVQHRTIVHGDIVNAMESLRAMNIVQSYLMPGFILNKTAKRPPKMSPAELALKAQTMLYLGPALIAAMGK